MPKLTRRGFLQGSLAGGAAAGLGATSTRLHAACAQAGAGGTDTLVYVFLRGGMDGLHLLPPIGGPDRTAYDSLRPNLAIPTSGDPAALALDGDVGLHPAGAPLADLYSQGALAIVRAVGMPTAVTRSHFDAETFVELGTPGDKSTNDGWIARHLASHPDLDPDATIPVLATGTHTPTSLLGDPGVLTLDRPERFDPVVAGWPNWEGMMPAVLSDLYSGDDAVAVAGQEALDAQAVVEEAGFADYQPANGAIYPEGALGQHFQLIAQMIKQGLGLAAATVDFGSWDTHNRQDTDLGGGGAFSSKLRELAGALHAFHTDLGADHAGKVTTVVQSEFGRRVRENADIGTDHGYGNHMLVLGGNVNGGRLYGEWPGIRDGERFQGEDIQALTDYRTVLGEILSKRLGNPNRDTVFPGFTDAGSLGVVAGSSAATGDSAIFCSGFEGA